MAARRANADRAAADRSFEELYREHRADVFRAALRELGNVHDAEDVTQAAFVDAYRSVLRGSEPRAPRAWLLAIAENVRRRRFRTAQRRVREEPTDADFPLAAELPHELAGSLAAALAELPAEQGRVFALRELGGRSYDEIAAETGASVGAVQMQLFRARRALRERLEPPVVRRRRPGALVPLPGWLSTLVSRADVALLTPRAAGAVGAAVLAVAGTTVAVKDVDAGGRSVPAAAPPAAVPTPGAAQRAPEPAPPPRAATGAASKPVPPAPRPRPTVPARPAPATAPAAAAVPEPASAPSAPPPAAETAAPVRESHGPASNLLELPRLPVVTPDEETELLDLPGPPLVPLPTPEPPAPELPLPPPPVPPLVPEAVTGATGAAGAGAAPLPSVPPLPAPPGP